MVPAGPVLKASVPVREIHVRAAVEADAARLSAIAFAAKAHWGYAAEVLERWSDELTVTPDDVRALETCVAERGGEILGFCALARGATRWSVEHFWVDPRFMRQGVGARLLGHAARIAAASGARELLIDADPNAEAFYRAGGARRVGSMSAPIPGQPRRRRPQLMLSLPRDAGPDNRGHGR